MGSRPEPCGFDQANLIAAGGEFTSLVALHHHTTTGFNPDHTSSDPAERCGFENFDDITWLQIQLHFEGNKNGTIKQ
jgi:hypothetical protein